MQQLMNFLQTVVEDAFIPLTWDFLPAVLSAECCSELSFPQGRCIPFELSVVSRLCALRGYWHPKVLCSMSLPADLIPTIALTRNDQRCS